MSMKYDIDRFPCDRGSDIEVDGITFTYKVVPDQDSSVFDDGDWYGELDVGVTHSWNRRPDRPDHFDGNSECLGIGRSYDRVWWQPPKDGPKRGTPEFAELRRCLLDLLEYGYVGVIVESEIGERSLGGIASMDGDYQGEVVCELIDELLYEAAIVTADVDRWVPVGLVTA